MICAKFELLNEDINGYLAIWLRIYHYFKSNKVYDLIQKINWCFLYLHPRISYIPHCENEDLNIS